MSAVPTLPSSPRLQIVMVATLQNDPVAVAAREAMRLGVMPALSTVKAEASFDLVSYLRVRST